MKVELNAREKCKYVCVICWRKGSTPYRGTAPRGVLFWKKITIFNVIILWNLTPSAQHLKDFNRKLKKDSGFPTLKFGTLRGFQCRSDMKFHSIIPCKYRQNKYVRAENERSSASLTRARIKSILNFQSLYSLSQLC